jgi:hypothetical protein
MQPPFVRQSVHGADIVSSLMKKGNKKNINPFIYWEHSKRKRACKENG